MNPGRGKMSGGEGARGRRKGAAYRRSSFTPADRVDRRGRDVDVKKERNGELELVCLNEMELKGCLWRKEEGRVSLGVVVYGERTERDYREHTR